MFSFAANIALDPLVRRHCDDDEQARQNRIIRKLTVLAAGDVGLVSDAIRACRSEDGTTDIRDVTAYIRDRR